jgi:hypothetical protein
MQPYRLSIKYIVDEGIALSILVASIFDLGNATTRVSRKVHLPHFGGEGQLRANFQSLSGPDKAAASSPTTYA